MTNLVASAIQGASMMCNPEQFITVRDELLAARVDLEKASRDFAWPRFERFNWVRDYFDVIARGNDQAALRVAFDGGVDQQLSFEELSRRCGQVADLLAAHGIRQGDQVLIRF